VIASITMSDVAQGHRLGSKIARKLPEMRCSFVINTYLGHIVGMPRLCGRIGSARVTVEIVILAMIAAFLGLRLYSVLGRRAEHEEEPIQSQFAGQKDKLAPDAKGQIARAPTQLQPERPGQVGQLRPREIPGIMPIAERGLREIAAADRRFDALAFLGGASGAYRMILEAFWRGDKEELAQLCDRDVYDSFVSAIDERAAAGETLDNRLVRIEDATISSASFDSPMARVTVRFTADIAAVTRDAAGNVIAGSLDDAVEARDVWTFSRNVNAAGPDWLLDETDEA
jgi:predicted lipid-binding transport protein (Tim44 family)